MMAAVRRKDTAPELAVRTALFAAGFRYRLHRRDLPGVPDIVLPGFRLAILSTAVSGTGITVPEVADRRPMWRFGTAS